MTKTFSEIMFEFIRDARNNITASIVRAMHGSIDYYRDVYHVFDWIDSELRQNYLDKVFAANSPILKRTLSTESWLITHVFILLLFSFFILSGLTNINNNTDKMINNNIGFSLIYNSSSENF